MASGASSTKNDLILASGVVYFSENFNALPHVVGALTTRASTTETLKADATTVDRTLARLLDKGSESLLTSTALLSAVSTEFEESRARVRDLKRRVEASLASLSGRRRDLNGLSFRQQQVEAALGVLESVEHCLRACQGPLIPPVSNEALSLEKAYGIYQAKLKDKLPPDVGNVVFSRLEDRKRAICKILRGQVLDSVSGRGSQDKSLTTALAHLNELKGLEETVADALRLDYKLAAPSMESLNEVPPSLPNVECSFLSFPPIESIEKVAHLAQSLISWGDLLMERSNQFQFALKSLHAWTATREDGDATWKFVQESVEKRLGPLLDAFARPSAPVASGRVASVSPSDSIIGVRPKFYTRKRIDKLVQTGENEDEASDDASGIAKENTQSELRASPYHLAIVSRPLLEFIRRHDPLMNGRLCSFIKQCCETSLRSVINRDSATLFKINSASPASDFLRSCLRLQSLVKELREKVFVHIEFSDSRQLLLDVCTPFIHACRQRIDTSVDSPVSAWLAQGGAKLAQQMKSDPLFLAMEARRSKGDTPQRALLLEAAFDHLKQTLSSKDTAAMQRPPNSDLAMLVALSSCLHQVALLMGSDAAEERLDVASSADYALFAVRVDLLLKVDSAFKEFSSKSTSFAECAQKIAANVREARSLMEDWMESPAILDFIFLPSVLRVAQYVARVVEAGKQDELRFLTQDHLFSLHSAFASALVDATEDPWSDLSLFNVLQHALRVVQTWPDNTSLQQAFVSDADVKERHKQMLVTVPTWHFLFSQEAVLRM